MGCLLFSCPLLLISELFYEWIYRLLQEGGSSFKFQHMLDTSTELNTCVYVPDSMYT